MKLCRRLRDSKLAMCSTLLFVTRRPKRIKSNSRFGGTLFMPNIRAQAGRAERVQHETERESRPCLQHACWVPSYSSKECDPIRLRDFARSKSCDQLRH